MAICDDSVSTGVIDRVSQEDCTFYITYDRAHLQRVVAAP